MTLTQLPVRAWLHGRAASGRLDGAAAGGALDLQPAGGGLVMVRRKAERPA
jgi:hypothetical protein